MQPYSVLLPSAAIVPPPPHPPHELRRQASIEGTTPASVHYSPGFHAEGRWGFGAERGRGKRMMEGGRNNMYHIVIIKF